MNVIRDELRGKGRRTWKPWGPYKPISMQIFDQRHGREKLRGQNNDPSQQRDISGYPIYVVGFPRDILRMSTRYLLDIPSRQKCKYPWEIHTISQDISGILKRPTRDISKITTFHVGGLNIPESSQRDPEISYEYFKISKFLP